MKKIVMQYDDQNIYDINGMLIMPYMGLQYEEYSEANNAIDNIIKLKDAGFSADEILAIDAQKLI